MTDGEAQMSQGFHEYEYCESEDSADDFSCPPPNSSRGPPNDSEPRVLTADDKQLIADYLKGYYEFVDMRYEGDPNDADQAMEFLVACRSARGVLEAMYERIPDIAKEEAVFPNIHEY